MKPTKPAYFSLFALVVVIWSACSSGKSAYEHGNYYDAVMTSINRLRRNADNKKSSETLRASYPMAVRYYEDKANAALTANVEFKYREVVQHYTTLQSMYDEIQRSPGALRVIPNPNNYQAKLAEARQKAAEESYNAGIMALGAGDRANARKAYYLFMNANGYVPGYRDVTQKIEQSRWAATVKVAVEPIPVVARNYALDAHYFDSKLNEYLQSHQTNEFVRYYKMEDARAQKINPDHIVQLSFEEFSIGQVYVNEKESQVERDSVVVAYTYTDTKGTLLQKETEAPKIIAQPINVQKTVSTTDKPVEKKTTETQTSTTTETKTSTTTTTPVDTKTSTDTKTTTSPDQTKTEVKTEEKKAEEIKPDDKKAEESKGVDKPAEEKKNEDKGQGEKGEGKSDNKNADNSNNGNKNQNTDKEASTGTQSKDEKKEEQVTICHQPPGKPEERKTLTVPQSAVKGHLDHGDVTGECKTEKKDDNNKGKDNKSGKDGGGMASLMTRNDGTPILIASASNHQLWYLFEETNNLADTTKVYGKVKATVRHFRKTITSRGVLNFRIIDAKTKAVISEQRMPSESVWVSEWLTYNGDSRALSPEQINLARQRELPQPANQDLFTEFTRPLFDQITSKLTEFYKSY